MADLDEAAVHSDHLVAAVLDVNPHQAYVQRPHERGVSGEERDLATADGAGDDPTRLSRPQDPLR